MSPKVKQKYLDKIKADGVYESGIHPFQIIIDLDEKGLDQPGIAKKIGKSQGVISQVINRKSKSVYIMGKIANILDKTFLELWGMTEAESRSKKRD